MAHSIDKAAAEGGTVDFSSTTREERARLVSRLFQDHNRALVSFLRAKLHNEAEARDVAQEAYVKLLQLESPGVVSFLQAYLFKIATNIAIDRIRHHVVVERLAEEEGHLFDEADETASPERIHFARDELDHIWAAMGELPEKCKAAFAMHVLQERPQDEVAAALELSPRMVRYYVARGMEICKRVHDERTESDR
jgi:RNA polymerase sigma-70 factor (ECF subfamily)